MKANREDVVCTLLAARCLISDRADWTTHANGRDVDDNATFDITDQVCWCAAGAVWAVAPTATLRGRAFRYLIASAEPARITELNDRGGHSAVLDMFDRAIELAAA